MISLGFGIAFWIIFGLFFLCTILDLAFYEDSLIKALPAFYKNLSVKISSFTLFGKIFSYIICTLVSLPGILVHYIILIPLVIIIWGLLNLFFWLATLGSTKNTNMSWTSTEKDKKE